MKQYIQGLWRKPKFIASAVMLFALVVYILGLEWPLLIVLLGVYVYLLPMPRVFNSWFSRTTLSVLFVYAFLQVSAVIQRYMLPTGKFPLIAALTVGLSILVIAMFGDDSQMKGARIFNFKDTAAVLSCAFLLIAFAHVFVPSTSMQTISEYGGVQIVDANTHQDLVRQYVYYQTLAHGYTTGKYYPAGFHIAIAFMQHTVFGNFQHLSWRGDVVLYFGTYLSLCMLLCVTLVYLSLTILRNLRGASMGRASILATALTVGGATTVLHLLPFIELGFLNYIYVCAAALAAACYLVDAPIVFNPRASAANRKDYGWPVFAFLLLSFGATLSWPLLAPVFLLSTAFILYPIPPVYVKKEWRKLISLWWPIGAMVVLHLFILALQQHYGERDISNTNLILMAGALQNFDGIFLLSGLAFFVTAILKRASKTQEGLLAVVVPYIILVIGLIALHLLALGVIHYYVIKAAEIPEMLFLAVGVAYIVTLLEGAGVNGIMRIVFAGTVVGMVIGINAATVMLPLNEIRSLFRVQIHPGTYQGYANDAKVISELGTANEIQNYNVVVLHYDPVGVRLYANPELAGWANGLAPHLVGTLEDGNAYRCSAQLGNILDEPNSPTVQAQIKQQVLACAGYDATYHVPYYVVTDAASVPIIKSDFGSAVRVAY